MINNDSMTHNVDKVFISLFTALLVVIFIALTAADFATTLIALENGVGIELNPVAARGSDGIRIGFLVFANVILLVPLVVAFAVGITRAAQVPTVVLARWWRHILDIFFVSPLNDAARLRRPLRLVTAAMTLLVLKIVIVASNLLVIAGYQNPTSLLAALWTHAGLTGAPRYWAAYAMMIVPCYIGAVGLAAAALRLAQYNERGGGGKISCANP